MQHKGNIREVIKKLKPQQSRKIISVAVTCFCGTSAECLLRRNDTAEKAKRRIADQMQMPLEEILAVLHDGKRLETDGGKSVWDCDLFVFFTQWVGTIVRKVILT